MPQDGARSVVYRSFFSCDDPKGVVECKTSRKSKTDSHKWEDKVEVEPLKKQKKLSRSFSLNGDRNGIISKRPTDHHELHSPSSYQLMQVSREAQRLNQVIDTWSKEISFDRQSRDIAKDLLKGALDLKESLAMLGKLQEASQVMAKLKKKQKEKGGGGGGGGKLDAVGIGRTMSDRFGYVNHTTLEFENPRFSVDGSTRDCFEELREVIKESFARQNLLPKSHNAGKPHSDRPKSEFLPVPSSPILLPNSSKEERVCFDSTKSKLSRNPSYQDQPKISKVEKAKSDFSQDLPSTSSSQSSHFFSYEFDSSDSSISKSLETKPKAPNVIAKLMGLEEVISPKRLNSHPQRHYGKEKALNQGRITFDIDLPKPRRPSFAVHKVDPQPRTLEALTETIQFKGLMSSKSPHRPEHLSDISDWRKRFVSDAPPIVIIKPLHVSDLLDEALHRPKHEDLDSKKMLRKRKTKDGIPPRPNSDGEGALKFSEIHRKVRAEKSPGKRPIHEKGDKNTGDAVARRDEKSVKRQENPSPATIKASAPVKPKIQKKEAAEKTVPRIQKAVPNSRKPIEVETEKSRDACKSFQPNKLTTANPRKPEREPNSSKVRVSQEKGADSMAECFASHSSTVQKKNVKREKHVSEPSTILVGSKIKSDNLPVDPMSESMHDVTAKLILRSQQLTDDKERHISGNLANCKKSTSYAGDSTEPLLPSCGVKPNEATYFTTEKKRYERSNTIRNLLLGSTPFLSHAEELFDIYSCQPTYSHTSSWYDYETVDNKILLECAKELLENRSLQRGVAVHSKPKISISLDQLVNEICDGIEYLRSYYKLAEKGLVVHKLHTVLQKDMWGIGAVNGAWDLGWSKGFTRYEIDQVVVDIEQKIFSGIIEDVLRDVAG